MGVFRKKNKSIKVDVNIDYEKLAEAIVKAQENANIKKPNNYRTKAMSFMNGAIYSVIYGFAIISMYVIWSTNYVDGSIPLYGCVIFTVVLGFIGAYAFICQQESFKDKGSDAQQYFNTNIALIALIVALLALVKG